MEYQSIRHRIAVTPEGRHGHVGEPAPHVEVNRVDVLDEIQNVTANVLNYTAVTVTPDVEDVCFTDFF